VKVRSGTSVDDLAALLDPENAPAVHGSWRRAGPASLTLQLVDDDGCALWVTHDEVAALLRAALAEADSAASAEPVMSVPMSDADEGPA
jgi:hypothetical protein